MISELSGADIAYLHPVLCLWAGFSQASLEVCEGTLRPITPSLLFLELNITPQSPGQIFIQGWAFPLLAAPGDRR